MQQLIVFGSQPQVASPSLPGPSLGNEFAIYLVTIVHKVKLGIYTRQLNAFKPGVKTQAI